MSRGPDFLIIGAMKCGTSTLHEQLALQDGLFLTTPKEPNFFSDDAIFAKGMGWYSSLFDAAEPGDLCGESSTHYTKLPTYPETVARMAAALDRPRLIYMIRNPLERAMSHYIHAWSEREVSEDVEEAFRTNQTFRAYGAYGMQIQPFVDWVGAENILLLSLEEMKSDPDGTLARAGQFIGANTPMVWQHDLAQQNVSVARVRRLPFQSLLIDNPVARALRRTLVPKSVRTRIREGRQMKTRPSLPDALKKDLEAAFLADRDVLAGYFPNAAALDLAYPFAP